MVVARLAVPFNADEPVKFFHRHGGYLCRVYLSETFYAVAEIMGEGLG